MLKLMYFKLKYLVKQKKFAGHQICINSIKRLVSGSSTIN